MLFGPDIDGAGLVCTLQWEFSWLLDIPSVILIDFHVLMLRLFIRHSGFSIFFGVHCELVTALKRVLPIYCPFISS